MLVTRREFHESMALLWGQLEEFEKKLIKAQEKLMTDVNSALADLDSVISDLEGDITSLKTQIDSGDQAAASQLAAQIEARVSGMRNFLNSQTSTAPTTGDAGATTPPSDTSTGTDAGATDTTSTPTGDGTPTA